jgi:heat shock protein HslJ
MKRIVMLVVIMAILAAIPLMTGCAPEAALENTGWSLASYGPMSSLKGLLPDTEITATFNSETKGVGGSAGCNHYSGSYTLDGNNLALEGPFAVTEMWCGEEKDAQEKAYLDILLSAETWEVDGDTLTVTGSEGVLIFEKR